MRTYQTVTLKVVSLVLLGFFYVIALPRPLHAAFEARGIYPAQLALGWSSLADERELHARLLNPAAASCSPGYQFAAAYVRSFGMASLDRLRVDLLYARTLWAVGVGASSFGGELYSERVATISASTRIHPRVTVGLGGSVAQVELKRYGSDQAFTGDAGLLLHLGSVTMGAAIEHLAATPFKRFSSNRPARNARMGASIALQDDWRLHAALEFCENEQPTARFGLELQLFPALQLQAGYDTAQERMGLGLSMLIGPWRGASAVDHHPYLGWSRAFSVAWRSENP